MSTPALHADLLDVRRARDARGVLRAFNDAGVLTAADVHVAFRLAQLAGEQDEWVWLAAALAVRGPRLGHVCVDLETVRATATVDTDEPVDLDALPWPSPEAWIRRLSASALVTVGEDGAPASTPLRLAGTLLYLDRYWREERQVSSDLRALGQDPAVDVDVDVAVLAEGLARLFADRPDARQRMAAASAVLRRFAVVAGGPGTGKTTTVAQIVALLAEQATAAGRPEPLVALAAPTGKASARLEEAMHAAAAELPVEPAIREGLLGLSASTVHRLLGWRPDSHSRFRHSRANRLPHDVVIIDETSMVSLWLIARLIEAVRPDARLVLVGDPGQLTSIEAGAVLADIVGPVIDQPLLRASARAALEHATGGVVAASEPPAGATVSDGIVVLDTVHRFGKGIARVAEAIRRGDADAVVDAISDGPDGVTWLDVDGGDPAARAALQPVRDAALSAAADVMAAARAGAALDAIAALGAFRLLCAHRRGPHGAATWSLVIQRWIAEALDDVALDADWYVGRPLLVTENDYELRLFNGDTGVVVAAGDERVSAAFERRGGVLEFRPGRLAAVETVYAMTVHKSQGSQFATAAVLLPPPTSQILTRELLYTAVTRARDDLVLVGTEDAVRAAVVRPVARASGLRRRLWGG